MIPNRSAARILATSLALSICTGCSSTGQIFRDPAILVRDPGQLIGRPKVEKTIVRIVSLWEAASGKDPSDKPARGFAGQILFFGPTGETGARVHGKVVIYEYDNYVVDGDQFFDRLQLLGIGIPNKNSAGEVVGDELRLTAF